MDIISFIPIFVSQNKIIVGLVGRFTENAKRMSTIFHDRPMSALDTAVYWVEYVIRHKGAHHLRSEAVKLTWYQYLLLDSRAVIIWRPEQN
ncbi:UDP-glucuronosyltransferase 2B7-like isoform X2 [Aphis craccivora]|uniref:UDP-glucuronosyltransferase 2B7-like isoform X2 n=1 Tax=Aphis craccivora TaxID=307492 RepID=A0A6G0Z2A7_APHCR|nr:UDP-glucuronosyltransferase 2B7-like isoform X2 [Aphis craccivora]